MHTLFSCAGVINPLGCSIYISLSMSSLKNAILTFYNSNLYVEVTTSNTFIVVILVIIQMQTVTNARALGGIRSSELLSNLILTFPTTNLYYTLLNI